MKTQQTQIPQSWRRGLASAGGWLRTTRGALIAVVALAGLAVAGAKGIPDAQLGLSKTSVFEVPAPPPVHETSAAPGEAGVLPRAFPGAPPVVPHTVSEFLPITREENACLECHQVEEKVEGEPTPIPKSHFVDLRNAPGVQRATIAGARYRCVACHVARTDAKPLVKNRMAP